MDILNYLDSKKNETAKLLAKLIGFKSIHGNEAGIQEYLFKYCLQNSYDIRKCYLNDSISELSTSGFNLVGDIKGSGSGKSLIINAHTDVVPAPVSWKNAFKGKYDIKTGYINGRGACDDKGGVVAILLVIDVIKRFGIKFKGDIQYQFVIDEETGGFGTGSLIKKGCKGHVAFVIEPTGMKLCIAGRGCVWFQITIPGISVHMAEIDHGISAIDNAVEIIGILKKFEKAFTSKYGDHFLFRYHERPSQMNIGMIYGGDIASMVPSKVVLEGGIGFLPNRLLQDVVKEFTDYIYENIGSNWMKDKLEIRFEKLRNESFEESSELDCIKSFGNVLGQNGLDMNPVGFIASCDARLFHHVAKIPCITFGPGELKYAHSECEKCNINDIMTCAKVMVDFIIKFCN